MATRRSLGAPWRVNSQSLWDGRSSVVQAEANTGVSKELSVDSVPSRLEQFKRLSSTNKESPYDVLVIGGGATGTGCAFDAQTRQGIIIVVWFVVVGCRAEAEPCVSVCAGLDQPESSLCLPFPCFALEL